MENMFRGTVYVLPAFDGEGKPDFDRMKTLTAEEHQGRFYVQVMDAENAREAYEEKPVNAPDFIDRLVDFFCRLVGKRDTVCALWDAANRISDSAQKLIEHEEKDELRRKMVSGRSERIQTLSTREEQNQRNEEARKTAEAHGVTNYKEELSEWYLALYNKTHDLFPSFVSADTERGMAKLDQIALDFAGEKLNYSSGFMRSLGFDEISRFDVRSNLITTLAFGIAADRDLTAEAILDFLDGKEIPGDDKLKARMEDAIAKLNNPETRNSKEMKALIKKYCRNV